MGVSPLYSIHQFREDVYKVVMFKGVRDPDRIFARDHEEENHYDTKLNEAFCRARSMVLQYALCNTWDYFFTGTLDEKKFNRYDLDKYQAKLSQFIRDKRKAYGSQIQFLLIPEHHKDGAWHIHGMLAGLPDSVLRKFHYPEPKSLVNSAYLNWPDYQKKFGFCSLAPIKNPVATAFYITKYISKDMSRRAGDLGKHLYFHSRPLKKAVKASDVYYFNPGLTDFCIHDHDFCKTGMVQNANWFFPFQWDGAEVAYADWIEPEAPAPLEPEEDFKPWEIDPFYEQTQMDAFFSSGCRYPNL